MLDKFFGHSAPPPPVDSGDGDDYDPELDPRLRSLERIEALVGCYRALWENGVDSIAAWVARGLATEASHLARLEAPEEGLIG